MTTSRHSLPSTTSVCCTLGEVISLPCSVLNGDDTLTNALSWTFASLQLQWLMRRHDVSSSSSSGRSGSVTAPQPPGIDSRPVGWVPGRCLAAQAGRDESIALTAKEASSNRDKPCTHCTEPRTVYRAGSSST